MAGAPKFKNEPNEPSCPFQRWYVINRLEFDMVNLPTKFQSSNALLSPLSLEIAPFNTAHKEFLVAFHSSYFASFLRHHEIVDIWTVRQLVGMPPFSTNMAIAETKGQGWTAIPTQ